MSETPEQIGAGRWDMQVQWVSPSQLHPNSLNPNQQNDETFNGLVASIEQDGWTSPLQVVEIAADQWEIVAGEHRWRAAKVLQCDVPIIALPAEQFHNDRRAWALVKDNELHGQINGEKFAVLWESMRDRYDPEVLQYLMGFTSADAFQKVYKEAKAGLSPEMQKALEASKGEIKTIDDLSNVLNRLFAEYGSTLPSNMMVFSHSGKEVLWVRAERPFWKLVRARADDCAKGGRDFADEVFRALEEAWSVQKPEAVDNSVADTPAGSPFEVRAAT